MRVAAALSRLSKIGRQSSLDALFWRGLGAPFGRGLLKAIRKLTPAKPRPSLAKLIERATQNPTRADAAMAVARVMLEREDYAAALEWCDRAIGQSPDSADFHGYRARSLWRLERVDEAIAGFHQAIRLAPDRYREREELAKLYAVYRKEYELAESLCKEAIQIAPNHSQSYKRLAGIALLHASGDEAMARVEGKLGAVGDRYELLQAFALALTFLGRYDEAKEYCQKLLRIDNAKAKAFNLLAIGCSDRHDFRSAARYIEESMRLDPKAFDTNALYLEYLFRIGEYTKSQDAFRKLYRQTAGAGRDVSGAAPMWDGSSLHGKTILLNHRLASGFGDEINFVRFAPFLKDLGGAVGVESRRAVASLIKTAVGVDFVIQKYDESRPIDYIVDSSLLFSILGVPLEAVAPRAPYLSPDPQLCRLWAGKISNLPGCRIGITWRTNLLHTFTIHRHKIPNIYTNKTMTLSDLTAVAEIPGVVLYNLQKEAGQEDFDQADWRPQVVDLASTFRDFNDTAAAISALDLVVTVDTGVAHLAGALGKPTFLMLPYTPGWRWMLDREDTPWYPSVRLFRQSEPGEWGRVVSDVERAVREFSASIRRQA